MDQSDGEETDLLVSIRSALQTLTNAINQQTEFIDPVNGGDILDLRRAIIELSDALDSRLGTLGRQNFCAVEWPGRFEGC